MEREKGEGLMLRRASSAYVAGRSSNLLKVSVCKVYYLATTSPKPILHFLTPESINQITHYCRVLPHRSFYGFKLFLFPRIKVKTSHDDEAVVEGHEEGKGKHVGRCGALRVKNRAGVSFKVFNSQRVAEEFGVERSERRERLCFDQLPAPNCSQLFPSSCVTTHRTIF